ncbi:hypothetical protein [Salinicola sp. CPA57]|uniref:hypothetical protein n=1 Tax=Salinicola sp. CPA57 TaxID=1949080 RepID=UPI000DA18AD0|nr:hypothetical protein [Salinicola sp. CPA57]
MTVLSYPAAAPAITSGMRALMYGVQDLSLDVSAQGEYSVHVYLWGHTYELDIRVTKAPHKLGAQSIWAKTIYLPRNHDGRPALSETALDDLSETIAYLQSLLIKPEARA